MPKPQVSVLLMLLHESNLDLSSVDQVKHPPPFLVVLIFSFPFCQRNAALHRETEL